MMTMQRFVLERSIIFRKLLVNYNQNSFPASKYKYYVNSSVIESKMEGLLVGSEICRG